MLKMTKIAIAVAATFTMLSGTAFAGSVNVGDKANTPRTEQQTAMDTVVLGRQLAAYGIENQDSLSLILSARMAQQVQLRDSARTKDGEVASEAVTDSMGSSSYLLAQAKEFSNGRAEVLALIADTEKAGATRGRVEGPARTIDSKREPYRCVEDQI